MSYEYFKKAQEKVLPVHDGDYVAEGIVATARKIYNEAQALKPPHLTFTDDALADLSALMRHHNMSIRCATHTNNEVRLVRFCVEVDEVILSPMCMESSGGDDILEITADDIKPEKGGE